MIDVATWTEVARMRGGQGGSLRDVDLNSDETRAATAGFDKFVRVWDLATESLVIEIEVDADLPQGLTDVEFLNDTTLIVAATDSSYVLVFTLDPDELIDIAVRRITRGLTDQECATYGIDPCRTLDELRAS